MSSSDTQTIYEIIKNIKFKQNRALTILTHFYVVTTHANFTTTLKSNTKSTEKSCDYRGALIPITKNIYTYQNSEISLLHQEVQIILNVLLGLKDKFGRKLYTCNWDSIIKFNVSNININK